MPEDYEAEARARNMNARMLTEFVDGSKTMVEMVAVANATGLRAGCARHARPLGEREELARVLSTRRMAVFFRAPAPSTTRSAKVLRPASSASSSHAMIGSPNA